MFVPNKTISLSESFLSIAAKLLPKLRADEDIFILYQENKRLFDDLSQYMDTLVLLFVLEKIEVDFEKGVLQLA
ncbi:MAG: ABC-three component system middle component 7 [Aliiglaciecola sp.]|uniref:ABC-three component system middle component 7 n=1 Tax=Aliiglaciecola sp. TaxID=1872441 RepID=UPI003296FFFB